MSSIFSAIKADLIKDNLPSTLKWFIWCLLGISLVFVGLFSFAVFGKLDKQAQYNISANSEYYRYTPEILKSPLFNISNYQLAENCDPELVSEIISQPAELTFEKPLVVHITRIYLDKIQLDIKSHTAEAVAIDDFLMDSLCTTIFISLDESTPVFSAKLVGAIEVGPESSDATFGHFPILNEGTLSVTDRTLFRELYQFQPYEISQGDRIIVNSNNSANGLLRATYDEPAINSVIIGNGGVVSIQKYRGNIFDIESTFLNRIKEDHDLAIALSFVILVLQFVYAAIAYLLRIELIEQIKESSKHENN